MPERQLPGCGFWEWPALFLGLGRQSPTCLPSLTEFGRGLAILPLVPVRWTPSCEDGFWGFLTLPLWPIKQIVVVDGVTLGFSQCLIR